MSNPSKIGSQLKEHQPAPKMSQHRNSSKSRSTMEAQNMSQPTHQMSASMQLFMSKMLAKETALYQNLEEIRVLEELCERQRQNLSEIHINTEQVNHCLEMEMKKREALAVKFKQSKHVFDENYSECQDVTNALHRMDAERQTFDENLCLLKETCNHSLRKYEDMKNKTEKENQHLRSLLLEEQLKYEAHEIKLQKDSHDLVEKFKCQDATEQAAIDEDLSSLHSIEAEISQANQQHEILEKQLELRAQEQLKHMNDQLKQLENLLRENEFMKTTLQSTQEEHSTFLLRIQTIEHETLRSKQKQESIESRISQVQSEVEHLSKTFSDIETEEKIQMLEYEEKEKQNSDLDAELEMIRKELLELEGSANHEIGELTDGIRNILSMSAEEESKLKNRLEDEKEKFVKLSNEEEEFKQLILGLKDEVRNKSELNCHILESNRDMEANISACQEEIENLKEEKLKMCETLNSERFACNEKEQSISESEALFEGNISELISQIESLEHQEKLLKNELESAEQIEQTLLLEIREVEKNSTDSFLDTNEKHNRIFTGLQDQIKVSETDLEKLSSDFEKSKCEAEHRLMHLQEMIEEKDSAITKLKLSVDKLPEELESHDSILKTFSNEQEEKEIHIVELTKKISENAQDLELKKKCESDIRRTIEGEKLRQREVSDQISDLNCKLQEAQRNQTKVATDYENDKQVFLCDLLKLQQTHHSRSEQINALGKQFASLKQKVIETQSRAQEFANMCENYEEKATILKKQAEESNARVIESQENLVSSDKQVKQAKTETALMKAKADHLRNKIAARKAAKKENNVPFKRPLQNSRPPREVTAQYNAPTEEGKDSTPRSILKTPSKELTPVAKSVSFTFELNDSSSSSIILEPEMFSQMAVNPALKREIMAQHSQNQAPKRLKMQNLVQNLPESKSSDESPLEINAAENEISSSTPESAGTGANYHWKA